MRFLRNLTFLGLLVGLIATAPVFGQTVTCGGVSFTHGEKIGYDNGDIVVQIISGRIYLKRGVSGDGNGNGEITETLQNLYAAKNNGTLKAGVEPIINTCINARDPSTSGLNYLGTMSGNTITCNGKTITNNVWMSYWPDDADAGHNPSTSTAARTYNIPRFIDGLLRLDVVRKSIPNNGTIYLEPGDLNRTPPNDNWSIFAASFQRGFLNPDLNGFSLTSQEIFGCFYPQAPRYPDAPASNCTTAPVISGISSISSTGLTASFSPATSATSVNWVIKDGSSTQVRNGTASVSSGTSAAITFTALSPGTYTLEVQGGSCVSSVDSESFTISRSACPSGPTVFGNVTNITNTGLTFQFDGSGVNSVDWRILNSSSSSVASGSINPVTSSTNNITFSSLSNGNYTLEIQGGATCSSTPNTKAFTIGSSSPCTTAPTIASSGITSITTTSLSVAFSPSTSATSISWVIKDGSSASVRSGNASVSSGTSAGITYTALSPGTYTLEVQGGNCTSSASTQQFTISKPACASGPTIFGNLSNVSSTGLTFQFDGSGINSIDWRILNSSSSSVASGSINPVTSNTNSITYSSLSNGNYTLEIQGGATCSSTPNTKAFTLGSISPCGTAPQISTITNVSGTGLTINFTGANSAQTVAWAVKNGSGSVIASGNKSTGGASSTAITFERLQSKSNTLEVQGVDCSSSVSSKAFTVNCAVGPTITSIPNGTIGATGLTFYFNGSEIYSIDWRILNSSSSPVRTSSSSIVPVNDHPAISYASLGNGNYTLEIQGGNTCQSTPNTMAFAIGGALPINVASFKAETKKEGVALSWSVVSESNGKGFELLRYDDVTKVPMIIAEIPLTEARIGNYQFLDEAPLNGTNYYQLKTVDLDGTFSLGRIVSAKFEQLYKMVAAPNPAKDFVEVDFESRENGSAVFETYTTSGKKIQRSEHVVRKGLNHIKIGMSSLSAGSYILKVVQRQESHSLRVLKVD